ncbi:TetR/AcrR family transcriptional regulator [Microbacterium marinilacus]|uniref:TetR family transcriptional regulator n=1 Tax=Microbacterium marinilacus TaxID=415209 RepID=A0ABP7BLV8_9MICO|nr:TetR/AcrR family transcriptional regulator [Microbacterium marinilacus]MBY0688788.1 TetR/AcrR family transcriptional regulator [Microbacterium marinilacus]
MKQPESRRQAKRRETHDRIAAAGLRLFLEHGYEATTLDAIAEAAGISRRTLFYYFASKDDIVLTWNGAGKVSSAIGPAILSQSPDSNPLDAARTCLVDLASQFEAPESRAVDALMRSSEGLRLRKDAVFVALESTLVEAFATLWLDPARQTELRTTAMIAVGVLRLALDDWRDSAVPRPLADHISEGFAALDQVDWSTTARRA